MECGMRIFLVVFLALILALPSWLSHTVTTEGWGASVAYEAWLIFHVGIVFAEYLLLLLQTACHFTHKYLLRDKGRFKQT